MMPSHSNKLLLLRKWAVVRIPYSVSTHYALRTTHSIFVIQGDPRGHGDCCESRGYPRVDLKAQAFILRLPEFS